MQCTGIQTNRMFPALYKSDVGTKDGNNSHANCSVPYNGTELVLICAGDGTALWVEPGCLSQGQNCTVNLSGRNLTNDDSGSYKCRNSKENGTDYLFVDVNVLGEKRDWI